MAQKKRKDGSLSPPDAMQIEQEKRKQKEKEEADERFRNFENSLYDPKPGGHHGPGSYSGPGRIQH